MKSMGYHATLRHGNSAWGATGFRRDGSTTVPGRAPVCAGRVAGGPQAAVDRARVGRARWGVAPRRARPRLPDRPVDLAPGRGGDRASDGRPLPPRPRVVPVTAVELVPAAPGA